MNYQRIKFHLVSKTRGYLNIYNAPLFRAAFLKLLQDKNPLLSQKLHDSPDRKPYFITSLKPNDKENTQYSRRREEFIVQPGQKYTTNISIFDLEVLKTLITELVSPTFLQKTIRIGTMDFIIEKIEIKAIELETIKSNAKKFNSSKIIFHSPTFFKSREGAAGIEFFPRPITVFKFLTNQWIAFSPEKTYEPPPELLEWVKKNVKITSFNIKTESSHVMKKTSIIGTIGWVKYSWDNSETISSWIPLLLKFGEYSGLGALRTGGYGEIEVKLFEQ